MLHRADLYFFSPTGGTKKVGEAFAGAIAKEIHRIDLGEKEPLKEKSQAELMIAAFPVFGGRIPSVAAEKLSRLKGEGRKAVTLAVYGNRAYEDALLEGNDILTKGGFQIIASGAFIAQHSIIPDVAKGRPDEQDLEEIRAFAQRVSKKLEEGIVDEIHVPGNRPYKQGMHMPVGADSRSSCSLCGRCEKVCPVGAVEIREGAVRTDPEKCILCMACVCGCPEHVRILPDVFADRSRQILKGLDQVRKENEVFL